jgi:ABC-2 type transport system permease protein
MIGVAVGFLWGWALLGLDLSNASLGLLVLVVAVTVLSTSGRGLLMGCIGLITRNVMFVNNTVYFLLLLLSGANTPLDRMPAWVRLISEALPMSRGIRAARLIVAGDQTGEAWRLLGGELVVGLVYLTVGYVLFRAFETAAKRKGSLETV